MKSAPFPPSSHHRQAKEPLLRVQGTAEHQLKDLEGCFSETQQTYITQVEALSSGLPPLRYSSGNSRGRSVAGGEKTGCIRLPAVPLPLLFLLPQSTYPKETPYT